LHLLRIADFPAFAPNEIRLKGALLSIADSRAEKMYDLRQRTR
jgi:hypothetical protein